MAEMLKTWDVFHGSRNDEDSVTWNGGKLTRDSQLALHSPCFQNQLITQIRHGSLSRKQKVPIRCHCFTWLVIKNSC